MEYRKKGQAGVNVGSVITLIIGVIVAVIMLIFAGALGGQTYQLVETDIDAITNTTIKESIKNGISSSFDALEQTGKYMPLYVLGVMIFLILGLVIGLTTLGGRTGGGSAL